MRLAPKSTALRLATYLLVALVTGAAIIALLPSGNQTEQVSSVSSASTVPTSEPDAGDNPDAGGSDNSDADDQTDPTPAPTDDTSTEDEPADDGSASDEAGEDTSNTGGENPDALPLPTDATEAAAAISRAELAVRDSTLTNAELDAWGRRQQALYRHLSFNPEWAESALAGVDPTVADAVALNWKARQNLSSLVNTEKRHDELPAWRINPPLPPEELIGYYKQAEADTGIQWEFVAAINLIETRMGRIEGISTAGAVGPMQFLPTTWAECCEGDPSIPADAIAGAAKYLTDRGGPENMDKAIFGYNNSNYYVEAVTSYANVMMENERAYYGYHAWEIYFLSTEGLIRIPVGYEQLEPIAATAWLAENPETLFAP